jgi:hypothetical protein
MGQVALTHTLVAGTNENVNHVQTNLEDLRDFLNGANLTDENFTSSAGMYSAYRTVQTASGFVADTATAGDYYFANDGTVAIETADHSLAGLFIYIAAADFAITGRTTRLRVRGSAYVNAVAPARTITLGLYPITSVAGGNDLFQATLGTVVSGSTVAFASPSANSTNVNTSGDFTIPADGHYALGFNIAGGAITANSRVIVNLWLQQRWT